MAELKDIIAENISHLRQTKNLTQNALAKELNYTDKSVSKWENSGATPPVEVLKQIADYFDVSIDYLLTEHNGNYDTKYNSAKNTPNKIIITLLAVSLVWLASTIYYIYCFIFLEKSAWLIFIAAVPLSAIILIIFNGIWGKRRFTFILISILIWSTLTFLFLHFLNYTSYNLWAIYILGAPLQIAVVLWANLKPNANKKFKKNK